MDLLFYLFSAAALIATTLGLIAVKAPRATWVRIAALVVTVLFFPVVYLQSIELLSKPKPASFEWYERTNDHAEVLGVEFEEGKRIYLWLRLAGDREPRNYVIPWNIKLAEKLEDAMDDAVRKRSTVLLRNPFYRRSFDEWGDLNVEIVPPPLPPQKELPNTAPAFNPREKSI